jgi:UDP-3-O-[3-hydroxymyristoyl] glucosamine N-acyltransferase
MTTSFTLTELAARIGAVVSGDGSRVVDGVAPLDKAGPGQVTFVANPKYGKLLATTKAGAVIVRKPVEGLSASFLVADNPYLAFAMTVELFHPPLKPEEGISPQAHVHPSATLGEGVSILPFAYVGEGAVVGARSVLHAGVVVGDGSVVGEDCLLYPNVVLYHGVRLGNRVILHAGCVVGSDGFGFAPSPAGYRKIPQIGTVEIGDDVEVGANTTIDRAALGVTRVGKGTKLDNLVQIGHNVEVGENTVVAAQAGVSGSCRIGSWVMVGGQVGLAGHLEVGDGVMLGAQSGVADSVDASESKVWSGSPVMPHRTWLRTSVLMPKIPELFRRVKELEDRLDREKKEV